MMIRLPALAALGLGSLLALPSFAQAVRPGLWEITNDITDGQHSLMAEHQKMLATMSPEQRKIIENALKKGGADLESAGIMKFKMCLTREMAMQYELPIQQHDNCSYKRSPSVGGTILLSFTCTNPSASGEGQVSLLADTGYRMKLRTTANVGGQRQTMHSDSSGKWLRADCGNLKPVAMPKAK
jgi:hypothetical protein